MTLGEQLRKLREERNLTLQQVANGTHIRVQYIQALENDERDGLPSAVQGKGFVRVIAGFYNVPAEPLLDLWEGKLPVEPPQAAQETGEGEAVSEVEAADDEPADTPPAEDTEPAEEIIEFDETAEPETDDFTEEAAEAVEEPQSRAAEIFAQIGEELRRQRETVSLTLDDVERFTKVRKHYLQALEDGRIDDLPSPVQGRGMLSNYASFLNLDTDALLLQFAEALQIGRLERPAEPRGRAASSKKPKPSPPKMASPAKLAWRRLVTPDLLVGGALFIAMLVFVIWGAARVSRLSAEASVVTPPSISEILQISPTTSPTSEVQPSAPVATQAALPGEGEVTDAPEDPDATTGPETDPVSGESTPGAPQNITGPIQIHVIVNQRAFLRIIADGQTIFNGRAAPGSAYTFAAEEQLELLTGNAAALQVFYQQQDLGTLGLVGQVAALTFSSEGIITPTARPTATGQPTPSPTPTVEATSSEPAPTITPYIP